MVSFLQLKLVIKTRLSPQVAAFNERSNHEQRRMVLDDFWNTESYIYVCIRIYYESSMAWSEHRHVPTNDDSLYRRNH